MSGPLAELSGLRPARVCVIKPSSLGDVVHALPTLAALRALWPSTHLAWVVNRGLQGLLDGHPDLDEVIPFDRARLKLSPSGVATSWQFLSGLRRRRFDLAIDLQGLLRSGVMTAATGARVRVGLAEAREGASRFYTHRVGTPDGEGHAVDRLLKVAGACGADVTRPRFTVATTEHDRRWAIHALATATAPRLVLNLGARWPTKRWPPGQFAEVARRAVAERGVSLVAVGAGEDRPLVEALRSQLGVIPLLDLCSRTTLPQLAALAGASTVFLSNDTGPLHLAAATGARVVGVYTCTSPGRTGPYGPNARAVETHVWCGASCVKRCDRLECMTELSPERVWAAVRDQIDAAMGLSPAA